MNSVILYELAAFALPGNLIALCALSGGQQKIGRSLARRWQCLLVGDINDQVKYACSLAAKLNEEALSVKGAAHMTPEKLISKVRTVCQGAVPYTDVFPSENTPRISGFRFEVPDDRKVQWKAEFEAQARAFAQHGPVQRCPHERMVYQKDFPANGTGFESWQYLRNEAPAYVGATVLIRGKGEI